MPSVAPQRRARSTVLIHRGRAVASLAAAVVSWTLLVWALVAFQRSLGAGWLGKGIAAIIGVLVALAGASAIVCGRRAVAHSRTAHRLAHDGDNRGARLASASVTDWALYAVGISVTAIIVAGFVAFLTVEHGVIRHTFLSGTALRESWRQALLTGFWYNVRLFLVAEITVLMWGLIVALARMFPGKAGRPIRFLATAYADVFRGLPAVITIYLVIFGLQLANLPGLRSMDRDVRSFLLSVLSLTLVYGAYVAEVYRSGLDSIHWSQTAAARSLGLSQAQTLRHVVVPQAVRRIIPPLLNDFIGLQKDTTLLAFVGVNDVFNLTQKTANRIFNLSPVLGGGLMFLVITIPMARFTDYLVRRDQARMRANG